MQESPREGLHEADCKPGDVIFDARIVRIADETRFRHIEWVVAFERLNDRLVFRCIGAQALLLDLGYDPERHPLGPERDLASLPHFQVTVRPKNKSGPWYYLVSWEKIPG